MSAETFARIAAELVIMLPIVATGMALLLRGGAGQKMSAPKPRPGDAIVKQQEISMEVTALGYKEGVGGGPDVPLVIPEKDRQNIGVFGEIGSGKTSVMRMLIMQDIIRKRGFMLIDPHRDFAREVLSMIPKDRQDDVVYVSLASIYQFQKTVCFNPLECSNDHEKYIRAAGCIDSLKQYFADGWGHRLETIIRNMINLITSTNEPFKFLDIMQILFDENRRREALTKTSEKQVRDFWENVFPKFPPEAATAIYNKFDKMINTPPIAAMFNSPESTISIKDIIEGNKIFIVDLGSGTTPDMVEFVGTLMVNMFSLENRIRFDVGNKEETPFNIYIDEVHMFSPTVIRELLNNVRKYGMKVTVATQSVKVLDKDLAKELDDLIRCMVMFKTDYETAQMLAKNLMMEPEELTQLSYHHFAMYAQGNTRVRGMGKTKHIQIPERWRKTAMLSLEKYGKAAAVDSFSFSNNKGSDMPKVTPLEYFLVNTMHLEKRPINQEELKKEAVAKFAGIDEPKVLGALIDNLLQHRKFITKNSSTLDATKFASSSFFTISKLGVETLYSRAYGGRGAGGDLHRNAISHIAAQQAAQYHYCIPDLSEKSGPRADLIIYSFRQVTQTKSKQKFVQYDPNYWADNPMAVEVEVDPTKHKEQVFKNFEKNDSMGMKVWFVVFTDRHKQYVINALEERGVTREQYKISVMDPQAAAQGDPAFAEETGLVTEDQSKVLEQIGKGESTIAHLSKTTHLTPSQVMALTEQLVAQGKLGKSGVVRKKSEESLMGEGTKKMQRGETAFYVTDEVSKPAQPVRKDRNTGKLEPGGYPELPPDEPEPEYKGTGDPMLDMMRELKEADAAEDTSAGEMDRMEAEKGPRPEPPGRKRKYGGTAALEDVDPVVEKTTKEDPAGGEKHEGNVPPKRGAQDGTGPGPEEPDTTTSDLTGPEKAGTHTDRIDDSKDDDAPPDYASMEERELIGFLVDPMYKDRDKIVGILGSRGRGVRKGSRGQPVLFDL